MSNLLAVEMVGELRPELFRLIRDPSRATPVRLWRALTREERTEAALAFLQSGGERARPSIIANIARVRKIRVKTVESWRDGRISETLALIPLRNPALCTGLLVALHLVTRRSMLSAFLDDLGIEHDYGHITTRPDPEPTIEEVKGAADRLAERYPIDEVVTYLLTLDFVELSIGTKVDTWFHRLIERLERKRSTEPRDEVAFEDEPETIAELEADEESEEVDDPTDPEETESFTTLDRQLYRAVVDVAQGIEGAFTRDQLDDLIQEVIELNSSRHQSYFHAGLRDAVFDSSDWQLPAPNEKRERWYWTGYIQGLARERKWEAIEEVFDNEPIVRTLGDKGGRPSEAAVVHILTALHESGRLSEVSTFLSPAALRKSSVVFLQIADFAEELLRNDEIGEARSLYDLLWSAMQELVDDGEDLSKRPYLEIRRRRAHCYRQLGQFGTAQRILSDLLDEERDPEIRAMVFTDLGLIDADVRRLADLRLPEEEDGLEAFKHALKRGLPRFQEAVEVDATYSAHAQYCLGIYALAEDRYEEAAEHLELALSVFESEPARYQAGGLLTTARLYLGLALCLWVDSGRHHRSARLLTKAISPDAPLPRYLIADLIDGLTLWSSQSALEVAEEILNAIGPVALDILAEHEVGANSPLVGHALLERGTDESRGVSSRVEDLRRALPILLSHREIEDAGRALDELEKLAVEGVGREEFIELLSAPERYSPAWETMDANWARVRCYEAAGQLEQAANLLIQLFYQRVRASGYSSHLEGKEIVERIRSYGLERPEIEQFERGLANSSDQTSQDQGGQGGPAKEVPVAVRILFIGEEDSSPERDQAIIDGLATVDPGITLEFRHPGWTSNWGNLLGDILQQEGTRYDGVLISRYIRTEFGRQLRKRLTVPYYMCSGRGRDSIRAATLQLAGIIRNQKRAELGLNDG